jgi:hypothetical protein
MSATLPASTLAQILASPATQGLTHRDLVDAKKICRCPPAGTKFTNYESYMRAKRAKIVGCCCSNPNGFANLFGLGGAC